MTDAAATGLNKTAAACIAAAATGGAVCPATVTPALLESGLTLATFPSGGSLTFTITATVTATTGSVTNTVTVAPPMGTIDPTPGNNTASDSDTVIPQVDLSVTKTDGVTTVNANGTTTYTVVVANAGP